MTPSDVLRSGPLDYTPYAAPAVNEIHWAIPFDEVADKYDFSCGGLFRGPLCALGRAPGTVGRAFVGAVDIAISVTVDSLAGLTMLAR